MLEPSVDTVFFSFFFFSPMPNISFLALSASFYAFLLSLWSLTSGN
jgi:hypothetical protein